MGCRGEGKRVLIHTHESHLKRGLKDAERCIVLIQRVYLCFVISSHVTYGVFPLAATHVSGVFVWERH